MQNLQQQLEGKTGEHTKLVNLFNAMQRGSDQEATTLLARLRLGADVDDLLTMVEATQVSSRFVLTPFRATLPSITRSIPFLSGFEQH